MSKVLLSGNQNTRLGSHLSSAHLTVSFGPPKLTVASGSGGGLLNAVTVGLVQDMTLSQQRQVYRLFEVGNKEQWLATSKVQSAIQLRRILYDGPSLLKYVAYGMAVGVSPEWGAMIAANSRDAKGRTNPWTVGNGWAADHETGGLGEMAYKDMLERLGYPDTMAFDEDAPGSGDLWLNLASDLFTNQVGIMLRLRQKMPSGEFETYGAVYLEKCLVSAHALSVSAEVRVLQEQVSIEFARIVPLEVRSRASIRKIESELGKTF